MIAQEEGEEDEEDDEEDPCQSHRPAISRPLDSLSQPLILRTTSMQLHPPLRPPGCTG